MKSTETGILKKSDLYFSTPSETAKRLYYYPISAGHFFGVKNYHLVRENYNSLLITHIIEGTFTFVIGGKAITAKKGDTVFLDCYGPHEYYTNDFFESIWIHFSGANCREVYNEIVNANGNLIKCNDTEHVKKLLFRIFNGISGENPTAEFNLSLDIYKLFSELLNPIRTNNNNVRYEETVQEIKKYIFENLNTKITVEDLAKEVNMSVPHFYRIFKQQTGFSPYDYVLVSRLNRAKEYLQKTSLSISEIAYEVGFKSESSFIGFFKTNTGISPSKFRKVQF